LTQQVDAGVSVCIPVYNGAAYLDAAIESARRQTATMIEILVVDDGSSDRSVEIAEAHAREDGRIRVVENPENLGLTGNWWRCIELARCGWIKFLFQDDLLDPRCVEDLYLGVASSGAVLGFCGRDVVTTGELSSKPDKQLVADVRAATLVEELGSARRLLAGEEVASLALRYWSQNVFGEPTSCIIERETAMTYGPFDPDLGQLCDLEYWYRIGVNEGIWFDGRRLATFRVHDGATSRDNRAQRWTWLHHGEPALLGWRFLTGPCFGPVREAARSGEPPIDLAQQVARLTVRFRAEVNRSRDQHGVDLLDALEREHPLPRVGPLQQVWNRAPARMRGWVRPSS
jgi:glycosyltransferase involved in cell wall biosynthesis